MTLEVTVVEEMFAVVQAAPVVVAIFVWEAMVDVEAVWAPVGFGCL